MPVSPDDVPLRAEVDPDLKVVNHLSAMVDRELLSMNYTLSSSGEAHTMLVSSYINDDLASRTTTVVCHKMAAAYRAAGWVQAEFSVAADPSRICWPKLIARLVKIKRI